MRHTLCQLLRNKKILRQVYMTAMRCRLVSDGARGVDHVSLDQRGADILAGGQQECIGHAAAEDQPVDLRDQIFQHLKFCRHFRAANNRRYGARR